MSIRLAAVAAVATIAVIGTAQAECSKLPGHDRLQQALAASVKASGGPGNGGLELHMWATIVDRDGVVCAVAFSSNNRGHQWPGSRMISAQKANTANAFSLISLALSTANLYSAVQPGGSLFGLQASNPVNTMVAYDGKPKNYGTASDPMVGELIGGVNVFGGGLAMYEKAGVVGGLGVSGDTSCADHNVAWRLRKTLGLDAVPMGVNPNKNDGAIYDIVGGVSKSGFGQPTCGGKEQDVAKEIGAAVGP